MPRYKSYNGTAIAAPFFKNPNGRASNKMVEILPGFDDYQRKTKRVLPAIVLTPVEHRPDVNPSTGSPFVPQEPAARRCETAGQASGL